jgi:hypothetical protein
VAGIGQGKTQQAFTRAQNDVNKQAFEASRQARLLETTKQLGLQNKSEKSWNNSVENLGVGDHAAQLASEEQKFLDEFENMESPVGEGFLLSGQEDAGEEVKKDIALKANKAAADARDRIAALARLSSYGSTDQARAHEMNKTAGDIGFIGNLRQGSLQVANQEQNIAPPLVTPGSSTVSDILSGAGGVITSASGNPGLVAKLTSRAKPTGLRAAPVTTGFY